MSPKTGEYLMSKMNGTNGLDFGGPATYRIVVQGFLAEKWTHRLGAMAFTITGREGGKPHTTLVGPIRDQAELNGVIETLYGLHLPILEVTKLDDEGDPDSEATKQKVSDLER
jgi:hypothetical protein